VNAAEIPEPLQLVRDWCGVGYPESPPLMTVGTVDADGTPDARSLLLSAVDEAGRLFFHTDARSRKCSQIAAQDAVVLTLVWPELGRQLVVAGRAQPSGAAEADRAWAARSDYLRLLGWLNEPELVQRSDDERTEAWRRFSAEHPAAELPRPEWWIGYAVTPYRVTAWTAGAGKGSIRHESCLGADGTWHSAVLPG
jgi:pyridoxamine 5'-phosphate oxidase